MKAWPIQDAKAKSAELFKELRASEGLTNRELPQESSGGT